MTDMTGNEEIAGIPKLSKKKDKDVRTAFYRLGYTAANLEKKREQLKVEGEFSIIQKAQLSDAAEKLKELINDMKRAASEAAATAITPPDLMNPAPGEGPPDLTGGMPPGGMPPGGPAGGAPDLTGGMPPGGMPPGGPAGGAPDLMGGQSITPGPSL